MPRSRDANVPGEILEVVMIGGRLVVFRRGRGGPTRRRYSRDASWLATSSQTSGDKAGAVHQQGGRLTRIRLAPSRDCKVLAVRSIE